MNTGSIESAPEQVAGFRLLRVLGRGTTGVVVLAEQQEPRRNVALKLLPRDALSARNLRRFQREAGILIGMTQRGVARVLDSGVERTGNGVVPWIAFEYVEGSTLEEHVKANAPDLEARVELVAQLAEALQSVHEAGIVHCDLKPANVLVDARGKVHVVDFGLARLLSDESEEPSPVGPAGTLAYMAPEQAAGTHRFDPRADVYALGAILYELASDRLPIEVRDAGPAEVLRRLHADEPRPPRGPGIDRELAAVILGALRKDPVRRTPSAGALGADLLRWLADEPVLATEPTWRDGLARLWRRQRALLLGSLSVLLVLTLSLAAVLVLLGRSHAAERRANLDRLAIQRLSDLRGVQSLERRARTLWPVTSARAADMAAWLAEAEPIVAHLEAYRRQVAQDATLAELVQAFDSFERGPLLEMRARYEAASSLARSTIEEHAADWRVAIEAIVSSPVYARWNGGRRLRLTPQEGLVPLGPDPDSGLWEFACFGPTGTVPARDPVSGRIEPGEDSAIVLVLLPGGMTWMGVQSLDSGLPNFDPTWDRCDLRELELAPFFLAKFELTQGQWLRVMGSNPSHWEAGSMHDGITIDLRHPVEFVSWDDAVEMLARIDLVLPTEAQWEHGARGGTQTRWWTGATPDTLEDAANLVSAVQLQARGEPVPDDSRDLCDPWELHAPVGSLRPNPFGLHDVLGNVSEWCLDPFQLEAQPWPTRPGDGLLLGPDSDVRSLRGSHANTPVHETASAWRNGEPRGMRYYAMGVRPARALRGFRLDSP